MKRKRSQLWAVQCPVRLVDGGPECGTPIQRTEGGTLDDGVHAHLELVHRWELHDARQKVVEQIAARVARATSHS